jgi:carboxymethylenebutenolidase
MSHSVVVVVAVLVALVLVGFLLTWSAPRFGGPGDRSNPATTAAAMLGDAMSPELPPGEADAVARLNASPRHGEWVFIPAEQSAALGAGDSVRAFIVYPMRSDKAPVVIVVHEIFGLTPWIRAVADQLAADGFIAVAPDFIAAHNVNGTMADGPDRNQAVAAVMSLATSDVHKQLDAAVKYATSLPSASASFGVVGFCWGGGMAFLHAAHAPALGAAVGYYGAAPAPDMVQKIGAPLLGLFAGNDARVNSSVAPFQTAANAAGLSFTAHTFDDAHHGFLRQANEKNVEATRRAWPLTIRFLKSHLEAR